MMKIVVIIAHDPYTIQTYYKVLQSRRYRATVECSCYLNDICNYVIYRARSGGGGVEDQLPASYEA